MSRVLVRSAFYTNHKNNHTAIALAVESEEIDGEKLFDSSEETYARLWLKAMIRTILVFEENLKGDVHLILLTGQPELGKITAKIEKLYCKMLSSKKEITRERIARMVHAAGHFHSLPNDDLYTDLLVALWNCKKTMTHFIFEQKCAGSPANAKLFNMARLFVAPDSEIKARTSKVK